MTLQEYQLTPKTVYPQELIGGILHVADAPFVSHQRVVFKMARALQVHVERADRGEVLISPIDVILDTARPLVLQPDLLYVSAARSHIIEDRICGAPDLVVEVLSPNPRIGRLEDRLAWFAQYGVREAWVYRQHERRLDIVTCRDRVPAFTATFKWHTTIRSTVLPELKATVSTLAG